MSKRANDGRTWKFAEDFSGIGRLFKFGVRRDRCVSKFEMGRANRAKKIIVAKTNAARDGAS